MANWGTPIFDTPSFTGSVLTWGSATYESIAFNLTNLIAAWEFEDGSGSNALDSSGGGKTLTGYNSPTWDNTHQKLGVWCTTTSTSGFESWKNSAINLVNQPITIAGWVKSDGGTSYYPFGAGTQTSLGKGLHAGFLNAASPARIRFDMYGSTLDSIGTYTKTDWNFLVFTFDPVSDIGCIYVNGNLDNSGSMVHFTGTTNVFVGRNGFETGSAWSGYIDGVSVWKRVLSLSEVQTLYNSGIGRVYPWTA